MERFSIISRQYKAHVMSTNIITVDELSYNSQKDKKSKLSQSQNSLGLIQNLASQVDLVCSYLLSSEMRASILEVLLLRVNFSQFYSNAALFFSPKASSTVYFSWSHLLIESSMGNFLGNITPQVLSMAFMFSILVSFLISRQVFCQTALNMFSKSLLAMLYKYLLFLTRQSTMYRAQQFFFSMARLLSRSQISRPNYSLSPNFRQVSTARWQIFQHTACGHGYSTILFRYSLILKLACYRSMVVNLVTYQLIFKKPIQSPREIKISSCKIKNKNYGKVDILCEFRLRESIFS